MQAERCLAITILNKQPSKDQQHPNVMRHLSGCATAQHALHLIRKSGSGKYITTPDCTWKDPSLKCIEFRFTSLKLTSLHKNAKKVFLQIQELSASKVKILGCLQVSRLGFRLAASQCSPGLSRPASPHMLSLSTTLHKWSRQHCSEEA